MFFCCIMILNSMVASAQGVYHVMQVPYISQLYPVRAVVGCEATALLMGMQYKGIATQVDLRAFLDAMPKSKTNPAKGFAGSPYVASEKIRTTIYPAAITEYANRYAQGMIRDISGSELEIIKWEVLNDNPVMIYATMYWKKPYYRSFMIEGEQQWLLRNNHAVLIVGYDEDNRKFYIADPYNKQNTRKPYFYWIEEEKLKPIYDERKWAVAVGAEVPISAEQLQAGMKEAMLQVEKPESKIVMEEKSFEGKIYAGFDWDEAVYLDAADVFEKENHGTLTYSEETGGCVVRRERILDINLVNGYLFEQGRIAGKLGMMPMVLKGKVYLAKEDILLLLSMMK